MEWNWKVDRMQKNINESTVKEGRFQMYIKLCVVEYLWLRIELLHFEK